MRFKDFAVYRAERFSLGVDAQTGRHYLAIPVSNRLVDYEEYYDISEAEFLRFQDDMTTALAFAEACRRREKDHLLVIQPGSDRGVAS